MHVQRIHVLLEYSTCTTNLGIDTSISDRSIDFERIKHEV